MIEYNPLPVGANGNYAVERTHNGQKHYLALTSDKEQIGEFSLGFATATCKALRSIGGHAEQVWLPWRTAHLPSKKPAAMYPPQRQSVFDHSGRA